MCVCVCVMAPLTCCVRVLRWLARTLCVHRCVQFVSRALHKLSLRARVPHASYPEDLAPAKSGLGTGVLALKVESGAVHCTW